MQSSFLFFFLFFFFVVVVVVILFRLFFLFYFLSFDRTDLSSRELHMFLHQRLVPCVVFEFWSAVVMSTIILFSNVTRCCC